MMDEDERRALEAKGLLENRLLNEAFHVVRDDIVCAIEDCPLDNDAVKDKLMTSLQSLRRVRTMLEDYMYTGQRAKINLEEF